MGSSGFVKDRQTVTAEGERVDRLIDGVLQRAAKPHIDERGSLCEILSADWEGFRQPLVHAYEVVIRPGRVKGWVYHKIQSDRVYVCRGTIKCVLYDIREESPTYRAVNELYLSQEARSLVLIPPGVVHALQNVGKDDALFINLPTHAYNYASPDKFRLPLDSGEIPYRFNASTGW
ncbi:MAG TPA: dTDP-4-dehydrorhamnose 3,5-epimerase family protein [Azospirillaceae bacterium]|nr:dTDP-4-dehydrorhamnose 3,5-epimerase family protein [Azospirillaceae bacterium]HRQ80746.1 dTDP-4-dehydrorhamnose 3,5-epimerase family protein [Azospirillaceae bacterium]